MQFNSTQNARKIFAAGIIAVLAAFCGASGAQVKPDIAKLPWMNKALSPDQRADMVVHEMTLDEKIQMVHGTGWGVLRAGDPIPARSNFGAGFMAGIDRLGIPDINLADSAVGVRMAAYQSRYATLFPSTLGAASSWDPDSAFLYGSALGRELRQQGFNMSIGGGVDITREPRNGRNFEYAGEDPVLAGTMTGELEKGVLSQHVMSDIKHYAFNDQETGRTVVNVLLDKKAMRESDLLAFEIAIGIANPSGVMCSYNLVEGDYACENDYLLNQVLKKDFKFKGWVLSDWGGTHSTVKAALNGLDQEMPGGDDDYFGAALKKAVENGQVPQARLDDMVHRILRSMFAAGVVDDPPVRTVVDPFKGRDEAQHIAEESIVLLKNEGHVLPLKASRSASIALIGSHADVGVLSGGGSAQVDAPGGNAANPVPGGSIWGETVYFPSSPLKYIRAHSPGVSVEYADGKDLAAAARLAKNANVAIVFATQPMREDVDAPTLSLPDHQDALVEAVAAANPNTIVVLETGGPVTMPWIGRVKGVVEMWYPGIGGAQALANILFGEVNPSGKLPVTFAKDDAQLPHPVVPGLEGVPADGQHHDVKPFDLRYTEGARVGYKWFESTHRQPLFPFGFGLSYTTYSYSGLTVDDARRTVHFAVKNTGAREGTEIAQVYVALPSAAHEDYKRLVAWKRVKLAPGESKDVTLTLNPLYLSVFNTEKDGWQLLPGDYKVLLGASSSETPLSATLHVQQ
jgi:beta-glucosidase